MSGGVETGMTIVGTLIGAILYKMGRSYMDERAAKKKEHACPAPATVQLPPGRQSTPRDFRGISDIAVLGERVSHLMSTVNTLVGSTQKLADGLNEVDRRQREMHGNFVTALNSLRMQQGMLQEAIDRNTATNDKLVEVLAMLASERR